MFDKSYLLPLEAQRVLLDHLRDVIVSTERLPIESCYNRIIASDVVSFEDLPAFPRSTVDGYALNSRDSFGAKEHSPAYCSVRHEVVMGAVPEFHLKKGEAAKIPTGGMLPEGADAVVMLEYAHVVSDDLVEIVRSVAPYENVIKRGEDIAEGELVLTRGSQLRAQDIGALAGIGITEIEVYKKPVVAIISTGDEILPPDRPLNLGQVRDINSFSLWGLIVDQGGIPIKKGIFKDTYEIIKRAVMESLEGSDMVLISGGTSAGTKDLTSEIINDLGQPGVLFHGVALKPGKPMIGGIVNNKPILGLPGHPAAVVVCFDLFIRPLLRSLSGYNAPELLKREVKAVMAKNIASVAGREDHVRVELNYKDGEYYAYPVLGKSGLITTLVKADGIVVISHNKLGLDAGENVVVKLF
jgi:molybdopterin molybdotransferase